MLRAARHPIKWFKATPRAGNRILAVALFVVTALSAIADYPEPVRQGSSDVSREMDLLGLLLVAGMTGPLAVRHRFPRAVAWVTLGTMFLYLGMDYVETTGSFGYLIATFTVADRCDRRRSLQTVALSSVAIVAFVFLGSNFGDEDLPLIVYFANVALAFLAWAIGDSARSRRLLVEELQLRAETAERLREEEAQRAVQGERARIARELHDVVAHALSVIVLQTTGARRVISTDPGRADEAMASVESTSREALDEMRRLLGVLRQEDHDGDGAPQLAPQPGLDGLGDLVTQCRGAGLDVRVEEHGQPRPLAAGADLSAFRIVQEALTNTLKHAGPARASVVVEWSDDCVALEVLDDGRGASTGLGSNGEGSGHGIMGMRERVELFGGALETGPRPGGGFRVRASLPYAKPADHGPVSA